MFIYDVIYDVRLQAPAEFGDNENVCNNHRISGKIQDPPASSFHTLPHMIRSRKLADGHASSGEVLAAR